jgi:hypothetical protein
LYTLLGAGAGVLAVASELGIPAVVASVLGAVAGIGYFQMAYCSAKGYGGVSINSFFGVLYPAC